MASPKSTTLFHFTKSLDNLKNILKNGFEPRYCLEDAGWIGSKSIDFVAFPVVCFCDIPLGRIADHFNFYGQFGIGMTQEWGISNNLNPVIYLSQTSHLSEILKKVLNASTEADKILKDDKFVDNFRKLFGHCKPLSGMMSIQGKPVPKEFYQESEWRYLAYHKNIPIYLSKTEYNIADKLDASNVLAEVNATLKFAPSDVKYLFVQDDSNIPDLVNFISKELKNYPHGDVQTLFTRIISQTTLENDI